VVSAASLGSAPLASEDVFDRLVGAGFEPSARDCKHCHEWESYYRDDFVRGLLKNGIGFRNVVVTTLRDVRRESDWPDDVKWVRDASPNMKGTPCFLSSTATT
jgi:hypothetical protein